MIRRKRYSKAPPLIHCQGCGKQRRGWGTYYLCPDCQAQQADLNEVGWVRRAQVEAGNRRP